MWSLFCNTTDPPPTLHLLQNLCHFTRYIHDSNFTEAGNLRLQILSSSFHLLLNHCLLTGCCWQLQTVLLCCPGWICWKLLSAGSAPPSPKVGRGVGKAEKENYPLSHLQWTQDTIVMIFKWSVNTISGQLWTKLQKKVSRKNRILRNNDERYLLNLLLFIQFFLLFLFDSIYFFLLFWGFSILKGKNVNKVSNNSLRCLRHYRLIWACSRLWHHCYDCSAFKGLVWLLKVAKWILYWILFYSRYCSVFSFEFKF